MAGRAAHANQRSRHAVLGDLRGPLVRSEENEEGVTMLSVPPPPAPVGPRRPRRLVVRRPSAEERPVRRAALDEGPPLRPPNLCSTHREVQSQADMEKAFVMYFGQLVREWKPCFDEVCRARFVCHDCYDDYCHRLPPTCHDCRCLLPLCHDFRYLLPATVYLIHTTATV